MNNRFVLTMTLICVLAVSQVACVQTENSENEKIWLIQPGDTAKNWEGQVFHLGNGYFGASCYGGVQEEVFTLAEKTFWTGGPGNDTINNYGIIPNEDISVIDSIKQYTALGNIKNADRLVAKTFKSDLSTNGGLSTIGKLILNFKQHEGVYKNYERSLDLSNSTVNINYQINGINYTREYFCSYPNRVLAIRLTSDKPNAISFDLGLNLMHTKRNPVTEVLPKEGVIEIHGKIDDNNRPYNVKIKLVNNGGIITKNGAFLEIRGSDSVIVYYTVATNYKLNPPLYKGADPETLTAAVIQNVINQSYDKIRKAHINDYKKLYDRTELQLENKVSEREKLPTNERLKFYTEKIDYQDLGLKELAFNFGKYMLISASRPGTLAAGLQGSWNNRYTALWNGTYQLDMNVTQTYMYGNALNLSECQEPFLEFIKDKAVTGEKVVKSYYGTNGWSSFMISDIWGHCGILDYPAYRFVSTGWLALILWEQYHFDKDETYLMEIYPVLKGASEFYLENLVKYKKTGNLVFSSGVSGEHASPIGATAPNYQDIAFAMETFENSIKASEILGIDEDYRKKLSTAKERLMPFKIGRLGQFQEWVEDIDDPNCRHRHISHLLALQPCKQINARKETNFVEAIKVTLNTRGDDNFESLSLDNGNGPTKCQHEGFDHEHYGGQVWSRAARLCLWLRVFDGDRADKIYNDIFRESTLENMIQFETRTNYNDPHFLTPFFLDGVVLSAGYVTEMVLQSQWGELDLLPALPSTWKTGSIKGIRARGGFTVDIIWEEGDLVQAKINADRSGVCKIRFEGKVYEKFIEKDDPYIFWKPN